MNQPEVHEHAATKRDSLDDDGLAHLLSRYLWFICKLHFNELPFRYVFARLDGTTSGPKSFNGTTEKQLTRCEKQAVVKFEPISSKEILVTKSDIRKDQLYLLEIVQAMQTGECSGDLAAKDLGPSYHSRWLTCANSILRPYVSQTGN
ncbi:hypothetical protein ILUMI_07645 [Ignelater luminosus]|uniref:Uncharacterized protein n=1 Tax=Ignelater luminosus TaxID=2038154 RepID=A0A8K0GBE6_IGNLU|nr:hypothetical protein ILUMI_07645 [Ignelater luminosus]